MMILYRAICLINGYCFGCFLTAVIVVKHFTGKSIFNIGSGNPGMANVMTDVSKKQGFLVLLGDVLKTTLAILIAWLIAGKALGYITVAMWTGLGAVLGHNYPVWHHFRGGKGVAVTCTYLVLGFPLWGTLSCVLGAIITLVSGDLWLGAISIPLIATPLAFWKLGMEGGIILVIMLVLMTLKNYDGVIKILRGEEKRKFRRKKKEDA